MTRRLLVWSAVTISLIWIAGSGWLLTSRVNPGLARMHQMQFEQRLQDCQGKFSERYDCKSSLMREQDREQMATWALWLAIILGPPLLLSIVVSIAGRRMEDRRRRAEMRARRREREARETAAREHAIEEGRRRLEAVRAGATRQPTESEAADAAPPPA